MVFIINIVCIYIYTLFQTGFKCKIFNKKFAFSNSNSIIGINITLKIPNIEIKDNPTDRDNIHTLLNLKILLANF